MSEKVKDSFDKPHALTLIEGEREHAGLSEGTVVHSISVWKSHRFDLVKTIGRYSYHIELTEGENDRYDCSFGTLEYAYASVPLTPNEQQSLASTFVSFIKTVTAHKSAHVKEIGFRPSDLTETVRDIDACINKILAHPQNTASPEELQLLASSFNHDPLFEMYTDLYHESFFVDSRAPESPRRAEARVRIFEAVIKKYLPERQIEHAEGNNFTLKQIRT